MKKRFKVFFMAFALVCILCIQKQTVFAANIVTVSATGNSTSATVSGTAENGVTEQRLWCMIAQVQILLLWNPYQ